MGPRRDTSSPALGGGKAVRKEGREGPGHRDCWCSILKRVVEIFQPVGGGERMHPADVWEYGDVPRQDLAWR